MWSLAVEEQFYFLWPFAVRFLERRQLVRLLIFILCLEPIVRAIATPHFTTFWPIFFLTPFQLDGLAAGSLLSLLLEDETATNWLRRWSSGLFLVSTAAFSICSALPAFHRQSNSIFFNGVGYSLIVLIAASFIAYILLHQGSLASRMLERRTIVFVGTISYGLYLYHLIIIELAANLLRHIHFFHQRIAAPITIAVAVGISWLSFRYYEQPLIKWGRSTALSLKDRLVDEKYLGAPKITAAPRETRTITP